MLESSTINTLLEQTAREAMAGLPVTRVTTKPMIDSRGNDALRVTIVVDDAASGRLTGAMAIAAISKISHDLSDAGDERLPIVEFATETDMREEAEEPDGPA